MQLRGESGQTNVAGEKSRLGGWGALLLVGASALGLSACRPTFPVPAELEEQGEHHPVVFHGRPFSPEYDFTAGPLRFDVVSHSEEREQESRGSVRTIRTVRRSFELSRNGQLLSVGHCVDMFVWTEESKPAVGDLAFARDVVDSLECAATDEAWSLTVSRNEATDDVNDYAGSFVRGSERLPVRSLHGRVGQMSGSLEGYAIGPDANAVAAAQNANASYDGGVWFSEAADPEILAALLATLTFTPGR